jgi:hypothetical protein
LDLQVEIIASLADIPSAASFSLSYQQILKVLGYSWIKHVQAVLYARGRLVDPEWFKGESADRWRFL